MGNGAMGAKGQAKLTRVGAAGLAQATANGLTPLLERQRNMARGDDRSAALERGEPRGKEGVAWERGEQRGKAGNMSRGTGRADSARISRPHAGKGKWSHSAARVAARCGEWCAWEKGGVLHGRNMQNMVMGAEGQPGLTLL
jgi:hypothetical protein